MMRLPGFSPAVLLLGWLGSCASVPERAASMGPAPDELRVLIVLTSSAEAIAAGRPDDAMGPLDTLVAEHGDNATGRFLRGVARLQGGDLDGARRDLLRASQLDPDDPAIHSILARVYHEQDNVHAAVAELERAIALGDSHAITHATLGHLYLEQQRWSEAFAVLRTAVEMEPDLAAAHRGLAVLFTEVGDLERAEQAFRQAVELEPGDPRLLVGRGHVLRDLGRQEEALACYSKAREMQPRHPAHATNIAATLVELGRTEEARGQYEAALLLDGPPGFKTALVHLGLGLVLEKLGDVEGAQDEYETALLDDPDLGPAHEALGLIHLDRGDHRRAVRHLDRALDTSGLGPESVRELALLHEGFGDAAAARKCAGLLRKTDSEEPAVAFQLAQLQIRSRDPQIRDTRAAIEKLVGLLNADLSGSSAAWSLLAEALAQEASFERAVGAMDQALQASAPDDPARSRYERQRSTYVTRLPGE